MSELKTCRKCGAGLDGKVEYELPNGAEYGRCSLCQRPYVITVAREPEEANQEPEPEPESEPEAEAE